MSYTIKMEGMPSYISADSAAQAVRKAKALEVLCRVVMISGPNGAPVSLKALEADVKRKRIAKGPGQSARPK